MCDSVCVRPLDLQVPTEKGDIGFGHFFTCIQYMSSNC